MKKLAIITLAILLINSCSEDKKIITPNGVWEQMGYGKIFKIKNDSVKIYDICKSGCTIYGIDLLRNEGEIIKCSNDSLLLKKNIKTYRFKRLDKLPQLCQNFDTISFDPIYNFEILWNTFNENYCYFEKRNIDWKEIYNIYKSKITPETSQVELFNLFDEMLSSISDGHIELHVPESLQDTLSRTEKSKKNQKQITQIVNRFELSDMIIKQYCQEYKTHNAGIAKWGFLKNNIAYVQMNAMWLMAFYDIPKNLTINEFGTQYLNIMNQRIFQRQDEIDGARKLLDSIFNDIHQATAIILDLRFNTGGKDEVGLELMGHFVNKKTKIASKKAKLGNSFTNDQNIYLEQRKRFFKKKVYILTSPLTASAAEVAVLATISLDNVLRIGSPTEGIFSDGLDKKLPNGWEYTLSNEIYEDLEGNNYEGEGIAPNIDLNYSRNKREFLNLVYNQLKESGDAAIEKIRQLQENKN